MTNHAHLLLRTGSCPIASITQDLSIPGSEVARRLNIDRSAVSRAVQRVRQDEEVMADVKAVWGLLKSARNQR